MPTTPLFDRGGGGGQGGMLMNGKIPVTPEREVSLCGLQHKWWPLTQGATGAAWISWVGEGGRSGMSMQNILPPWPMIFGLGQFALVQIKTGAFLSFLSQGGTEPNVCPNHPSWRTCGLKIARFCLRKLCRAVSSWFKVYQQTPRPIFPDRPNSSTIEKQSKVHFYY